MGKVTYPSQGLPAEKCPNVKNHAKHPDGFIQYQEWAEKKSKTHDQSRCPECSLWVIWTKKEK